MPYILTPIISLDSPGMWGEGVAYSKKSIYSIGEKLPPVNYDEHTLRPHSLTHIETPAHTLKGGKRIDHYYNEDPSHFYGEALVLRLKGNGYKLVEKEVYHWVISLEELVTSIERFDKIPPKILITSDISFINDQGFHDPNYVLTLSKEAATYLSSIPGFNLYGTSWKSSDYQPGSMERPIHGILFNKALILENLNLRKVPEGKYFMCAFPLPLEGASESPVVPVLFEKHELKF